MSSELDVLVGLSGELRDRTRLHLAKDTRDPLLFTGVTSKDSLEAVGRIVQARMGVPYKPAGQSALWKNWFDGFVKAVGGVHSDQTLYRLDLGPEVILYCAFWPWASDPRKVSVRLGVFCTQPATREKLIAESTGR